jgi:hypothetical protein
VINNTKPYLRKETSTLLTISAAILMLLLASPLVLPLPNPLLLQPVQAQTELTFQTPKPANGTDASGYSISITFYVHGTPSPSNPSRVDITNGTFHFEVRGITYTGDIRNVVFDNSTSGANISFETNVGPGAFIVTSDCSTSERNEIQLTGGYKLYGPVECTTSSSQAGGGNATTAQPPSSSSPSSLTGSPQGADRGGSSNNSNSTDSDRDGIPDSSDRCTHNSNSRCFKEDTTTTTTQQQPSSNRTGNQTR